MIFEAVSSTVIKEITLVAPGGGELVLLRPMQVAAKKTRTIVNFWTQSRSVTAWYGIGNKSRRKYFKILWGGTLFFLLCFLFRPVVHSGFCGKLRINNRIIEAIQFISNSFLAFLSFKSFFSLLYTFYLQFSFLLLTFQFQFPSIRNKDSYAK